MPAGFFDVGRRRVEAAFIGDDPRMERRRRVDLQVCGLKRHGRITR